MHNFQSKVPYPHLSSQNLLIEDITKNFITSPKTQNLAESLDLIQFKCQQEQLKQKRDSQARDVPLSYSKSIQYLSNKADMLQKGGELSDMSDFKLRVPKLSSLSFKSSSFNNTTNNLISQLSKRDQHSPVDSRVQKIIDKTKKDANTRMRFNESQHSPSPPLYSESESIRDPIRESFRQHQDQELFGTDDKMCNTIHSSSLGATQTNIANRLLNSFPSQLGGFLSKRRSQDSLIMVQEQFALKGYEKSSVYSETIIDNQSSQKQFVPLKIVPPFVRKEYTDKSKLFKMGILRNELSPQPMDGPPVLHSNDNLRTKWHNRVGNSTSKSSVLDEQSYFRLSELRFKRLIGSRQLPEENEEDESTQKLKSKVEQLLEYVRLEQNPPKKTKPPRRIIHHSCDLNSKNLNYTTGNFLEKTTFQPQIALKNTLSQLKQENQNHFFKPSLTKQSQMSSQESASPPKEKEKIIQNQFPGSKLIHKRIRQNNGSSINFKPEEQDRKVYFTIPDRGNFFRSTKTMNNSPDNQRKEYLGK